MASFISLPPDILREYFYSKPELYPLLARVSRGYRSFSQRIDVLQRICEKRPGINEILHLIDRVRQYNHQQPRFESGSKVGVFSLFVNPTENIVDYPYHILFEEAMRANGTCFVLSTEEVIISFIGGMKLLSVGLDLDYIGDLDIYQDLRYKIKRYLSAGLIHIPPHFLYSIYHHRPLCQQRFPNYAMKLTLRDFDKYIDGWISVLSPTPEVSENWYPFVHYLYLVSLYLNIGVGKVKEVIDRISNSPTPNRVELVKELAGVVRQGLPSKLKEWESKY